MTSPRSTGGGAGPGPEISVVVPTYNRRDLLLRTLGTVRGQQGVDLEVVVVDDGSSDGSADAVRALRDPRISVVSLPGSGGVAAARNAGLAAAASVAVLVFAVAWSSIGDRLPDSALAHAAPRTLSIRDALDRLWHPPPLNPAAPAGERALERHMPGEDESLVMVAPDLGTEILLRSGRVDRLLLGDAWEASFVTDEELPELAAAVDALRPGVRMLMDQPARELLARLRAEPALDPFDPTLRLLAPLQQWALERIDERFLLRPVGSADGGFTVVELSRRG
jgi:hypothetical protein